MKNKTKKNLLKPNENLELQDLKTVHEERKHGKSSLKEFCNGDIEKTKLMV